MEISKMEKKHVFVNAQTPGLVEIATRSGHTIVWDGYTADRCIRVKLDGIRMKASDARVLILNECEFYTHGGKPCLTK